MMKFDKDTLVFLLKLIKYVIAALIGYLSNMVYAS